MYDFLKKIVSKDILYKNMKVEFEINGVMYSGVYKGKSENFNSNTDYEIIFSDEDLSTYKVSEYSKMRFYSKLSVFLFKTQIHEIKKVEDKTLIFFKIPPKVYRVKRRADIRVDVCQNVFFYLKEEFEKFHNPDRNYFLSIDFSVGGLYIRSKKNLKINEKILINFNLGSGYNIKNYESKVVRKGYDEGKEYLYGIMFMKKLNWLMNVSLYKTLLKFKK
ncbi:hypothetical protein OSSY52_15030 [Tepiditoga spiralis]|uniref:PilZ domain-containing protein n=1 Tax=Tepiditoga spiralis TaxID=2108365 RepID=A0A7G1GAU0_9BACT|nr:PilZ domain-containing protein [Tepiditoga spiralis]BBE31362.1 hypothetical protein OSSY52_15030 [Tepiditoga spiralis]